jgi:hypothetical protein
MIELLKDVEELDIALEMLTSLKRPNDALKKAINVLEVMRNTKIQEIKDFEQYLEKEMAVASGHLLH